MNQGEQERAPALEQRPFGCSLEVRMFETTERLRTDSSAADVDSHSIVCSWCAQSHVPIRSCDFTNGYFQGREIERLLLYRKPAGGLAEKGHRRNDPSLPRSECTAPKMWDEDVGFA